MQSIKMERVISNLTTNYYPFSLLTPERASEVANLVRFVEMKQGEIFQIIGGKGKDYLFVVEGNLEIISDGEIRSANHESTQKRPITLPKSPATSTIVAKDEVIICHADREMLDDLIAWDEIVHDSEYDDELHNRLEKVRNSTVFRRLPLECVEIAFKRMTPLAVSSEQTVISQGEHGDAYYVITEGSAEVYQMGLYDDEPQCVATLSVGDAFGDEALVSGNTRNETVKMTSDGSLLVLQKSDFEELISKELVKHVNANIAQSMIDSGYQLIDVRYSEEYDESYIPGAKLIPLFELRERLDEFNKDEKYITYCHGGSRSAIAAMILSQNNLDVVSMEGGIRDWPNETLSNY